MSLILPENYDPHMTVRETQEAIKYIRDTFQREFGKEMNLLILQLLHLRLNLTGNHTGLILDILLNRRERFCILCHCFHLTI